MNLFNNILINKRILGVAVLPQLFRSRASLPQHRLCFQPPSMYVQDPASVSAVSRHFRPGCRSTPVLAAAAGVRFATGDISAGFRLAMSGSEPMRVVRSIRRGRGRMSSLRKTGAGFRLVRPRRHGWRPDYVPPCSWRGCGPYGPPAWRRNWNPNWGVGPRVMRSWPPVGPDLPLIQPQRPLQPQRPIWGPGPAVGNTTGGGIHFGNIRPYHAGR